MSRVHLEHSGTFDVGGGGTSRLDEACRRVLGAPLPAVFASRYGPIAPIVDVDQPTGPWGSAGQSRVIRMKDGATMRETLSSIEQPDRFSYTMTELTGPLKLLVASAEGAWAFAEEGDRVRVTWTWDVQPKGFVGRAGMPVFGRLWKGYARRGFDRLGPLLAADG